MPHGGGYGLAIPYSEGATAVAQVLRGTVGGAAMQGFDVAKVILVVFVVTFGALIVRRLMRQGG